MIRFNNIKVRKDLNNDELLDLLCEEKKLFKEHVTKFYIRKKSIDARNKDDIYYNYSFDIEYDLEYDVEDCIHVDEEELESIIVNKDKDFRPIIIGAGPAGLFAALTFIENGIKPIIFERGSDVLERTKKVERFRNEGKLDTECNVQFGEGGAGTFSDGKLTTGLNSKLCKKVLDTFYRFGAPIEITYESKPHIGTDNLINIIKNIREYIIENGGEYHFNERISDFIIEKNKLVGVIGNKEYKSDTVILAVGHSARDTFRTLYSYNINMEQKAFSVGVRIEHLQEDINKSQYGDKTKLNLPPAEYKLVYHGKDRSAYTFCMCPGGEVIASSSSENEIVTNGMSKYKRDGVNSNSALLVNVIPSDYKDDSPLSGIIFQEELENKAFKLGGNNYYAPIQRVEDFHKNIKTTYLGKVKPTYKPGVTMTDLNIILPNFVSQTLKEALIYFDRKIKGFNDNDAILTGVETRSSSPLRIVRDDKFESSIKGIYPCGEGPGYAGGIMSAAIDGIRVARSILEN